jgi:hypothetical protein
LKARLAEGPTRARIGGQGLTESNSRAKAYAMVCREDIGKIAARQNYAKSALTVPKVDKRCARVGTAYCHVMSAKAEDLVLVLLPAIREDISEIKLDMREVKRRLGIIEENYASLSRRVDRLGDQVERVNTRLELHEPV